MSGMRVYLRCLGQACLLGLRDLARERLLSACAILGLAAILAPLLVLYGVKFGVVGTLNERLLNDPQTLEISPVSSGHYLSSYLQSLAEHPDVAFVIPRTRSIAATMELVRPDSDKSGIHVSLEPTASGDPLLSRYLAHSPAGQAGDAKAGDKQDGSGGDDGGNSGDRSSGEPAPARDDAAAIPEIVLSATAAEKLGAGPGTRLKGRVERRYHEKVERAELELRVQSVLPLAAQQKPVAWLPLAILVATEDYRDGRAVPGLGWPGEAPADSEDRVFPGFRLHAASLESVERLRQGFASLGIDVYTHAEEIAQVRLLSHALGTIFGLVVMAAAAGFLASTFSSALAAARRKARILGLLRLTGFTTLALLIFPLVQSLCTAILGSSLAAVIYCLVASCINRIFAGSLGELEQVCRLMPEHFILAFALVAALSLLSALGPAIGAARVQPPEVMRDE